MTALQLALYAVAAALVVLLVAGLVAALTALAAGRLDDGRAFGRPRVYREGGR